MSSTAFDPSEYELLMEARQYDDAIAYVDRLREQHPGDRELRRFAALARGAKGEHELLTYDQMQVAPPPERIAALVALFSEATEVDPELADPWWDLAVVYARFHGEPAQAGKYLARTKALGYWHPMMEALEEMVQAGER
jgi:tetratricopeptide (TPR) repeat protein